VDLFDRWNRIANQFTDLIGDIADDVRAHVELGAALLEKGDYDLAIVELGLALQKRRDHARARYLLGLCYQRRGKPGDYEEAKRELQLAMAVRADYAEAQVAFGDALRSGGELEQAAESYRLALPLLGDAVARAEVERNLGAVYLQLGQLDKAVRELRKSVSSNPDDAASQGLLGQALVCSARKRGEAPGSPTWEAARQCLVRAAKAEQPDTEVLATLGTLLLSAGQLPDAEKALLRALREDATHIASLLALGQLRLAQGDSAGAYEQGLRAYAQWSQAHPVAAAQSASVADRLVQAEILALLARCHRKSGEPARALASFEQAVQALAGGAESEPPSEDAASILSPEAQRAQALLLDEALHLALSEELWPQAVVLGRHPVLSRTPDGLAAQSQSAELPSTDAEALLTQALALPDGDTLEVRLAQAELEVRRGNIPAAAAQLRRAAQRKAADPRPRRRLQTLQQRQREALPKELYGLLHAAHALFAKNPELSEWLPEAGKIVETLDRPLLITVMGEFNSGKSTFVNALVGEEVAPMGITPTTATINVLKYGREQGGRVVYRDGQSRTVPWAKVPALLKGLDPVEAQRIKVVEVLYPLDVLQRVNVVDTPGLNSIQPEHEATAREFIAQADAVIWLFTVDQAGKASEREALSSIRQAGKRVLGVLNKIDRVEEMADWAAQLPVTSPPSVEEGTQAATVEGEPVARLTPLQSIMAHLAAPETGLHELLEAVIPFSGREALLGRKSGDKARLAHANLPALEQALEELFFARAQAIKNEAARARLLQLFARAQESITQQQHSAEQAELQQDLRLCHADALLFQREVVVAERRRLIADADSAHQAAARETLAFVRPRRWPFGEHQAAPADRDFLLSLLDEKLLAITLASRARMVAALGLSTDGKEHDTSTERDLLRLLDEQVYGRYRAFSRGYLRGGKVEDFFVRVLPKLELTEAAIGRALERDAPTAVEILEAELLSPLRSFGEAHYQQRAARLQQKAERDELRRLDLDERVLFPLDALREALLQPSLAG